MLWKLLQVFWIVSILDLRCMVFGERKNIKLKTKNNGKLDPFSFEVYPTSKEDPFKKFMDNTENEEDDPEMALFFKDFDVFDDDEDEFFKSAFHEDTNINQDFFSKSVEESRNRYLKDVNNIDKMFKTPVKSNIDDLLRDDVSKQTTQEESSSKRINRHERTSVLNENNERDEHHTTKRSDDIPKTKGSNIQKSTTNTVNTLKPSRANNSLFSDVHNTADSNLVDKLVTVTEKNAKNGEDRGRNREFLEGDADDGLLDSQDSKSENLLLKSMNVVTEISVQETVNGKTVERKPSREELQLIENKILGISETSEQATEKISSETEKYDEISRNKKPIDDLSENDDKEAIVQVENPINGLIDDPNFADDDEVRDDKYIDYDQDTRNKKTSKNSISDARNNNANPANQENIHSNKENPQDPRKYIYREHKNSSNVSDVKIMFSETEGDFLDDDDSDYVTEKPEIIEENTVTTTDKNFNRNNNEFIKSIDNFKKRGRDSEFTDIRTELPELVTRRQEVYQNTEGTYKDIDSDGIGTVLNQIEVFVSDRPQVKINEDLKEEINNTKGRSKTVDVISTTDTTPNFTKQQKDLYEKEFIDFETPEDFPSITSNIEDKISISSQNINSTMRLEDTVTEFYEEFEDPITDISFTPYNDELDDVDRALALIKQILSSSEEDSSTENTKIQEQNITANNNETTPSSTDVLDLKEVVTIPFNVSTMPIESTTSSEDFIGTTVDFRYDFSATEASATDNENNAEYVENTTSYEQNIDISTMSDVITTIKPNKYEENFVETTSLSYNTETISYENEVGSTGSPLISNIKETELESQEISSGEVESMYNAKIEEYESLEDNGDYSGENVDGWNVFGNRSKEYDNKMNNNDKDMVKEHTINKILTDNVGDNNKKLVDTKTFNNGDNFEDADSHSSLNKNGNKVDLASVLRGIILNNTAEFSIKISKKDEMFYVPSSAHIVEYRNVINITWESNEYLNNSIALKLLEKEDYYVIVEVMVNLLTGNEFIKQKKSVAFHPDPVEDYSVSGKNKVVMMRDGTYIFFSNVDFLTKTYESLEYSEASMRERRLWHIEIASICLAVVAIIIVVLYVIAIKTKKKITLREKNELAQVTHC